jgi:NAD(P)-dependent dehydrogenase (short-subunit alcohol dehydrogenase family)
MAGNLSGQVAIVAGGSANIGKLFAHALADDGADVVVHYNSAPTRPTSWSRTCSRAACAPSRTKAT